MIKPQLFGADFDNKFKERDVRVSISVDTFNFDPLADVKVFFQLEPPSVKNLVAPLIQNQEAFDLILAWNEDVLSNCKNAKRFVFGTCWIDLDTYQEDKKNEISFLTSDKCWTEGHQIRQVIYQYLKDHQKINDFSINSIRTPPRIDKKNQIFENAKFSIIVENESLPNWITEKLIDCFATKTVPIYWGCPNVGQYFNDTGIIKITDIRELPKILNELTPETYGACLPAVQDNFERSLQYRDLFSRIDDEIDKLL